MSAEALSRFLLTLFSHRFARLLDTINVLAGRMKATAEGSADDEQRSHKRPREKDVEDEGATTSSSILHIKVLLGRREVEHLLAAAPTATTREAWRTGGAPDAAYAQHRRLHISQCSIVPRATSTGAMNCAIFMTRAGSGSSRERGGEACAANGGAEEE